ncbi:MAG: metallophosphoesterase [Planctomycetaceae bacterium]|nr:metallophosphoesterase [Planctomycetaceae bacterium]
MQLAFFGGVYNNYLALDAAVRDARGRGAEKLYCLGDLGAFGPHPDRVFDVIHDAGVECIQGNYDNGIGNGMDNCQCGYTDPRDNHFAQISYDYTYENTSQCHRDWMKELPTEGRLELDGLSVLLCHGSPRKTNEFLWQSTTSTHFLNKLADDFESELIFGTHTGIHWERELSRNRRFVNVGVLGRPENDGRTNVWYTLLRTGDDAPSGPYEIEFVPLVYDHERLAREMAGEKLPEEFIETIMSGWWSTCLEVLPSKERRAGIY